MINGIAAIGIGAWVYWAVTFTKMPFTKVIKDPNWSNYVIRLWAMVLGLVGGYVNFQLTTSGAVNPHTVYPVLLDLAIGTLGAIVSYHIGQPGFVDAFGDKDPAPNDVVAAPAPADPVDLDKLTQDVTDRITKAAAQKIAEPSLSGTFSSTLLRPTPDGSGVYQPFKLAEETETETRLTPDGSGTYHIVHTKNPTTVDAQAPADAPSLAEGESTTPEMRISPPETKVLPGQV